MNETRNLTGVDLKNAWMAWRTHGRPWPKARERVSSVHWLHTLALVLACREGEAYGPEPGDYADCNPFVYAGLSDPLTDVGWIMRVLDWPKEVSPVNSLTFALQGGMGWPAALDWLRRCRHRPGQMEVARALARTHGMAPGEILTRLHECYWASPAEAIRTVHFICKVPPAEFIGLLSQTLFCPEDESEQRALLRDAFGFDP